MSQSEVRKRLGHSKRLGPKSLLTPKEMEQVLSKERMRCDRHHQFFSLIVVHLRPSLEQSSHHQLVRFARILKLRLRQTDERGLLRKGGVGIMLPMTDTAGARIVLDDLIELSHESGLFIDANIFTYSPHDSMGSRSKPSRRIDAPDDQDDVPFDRSHLSHHGHIDSDLPRTSPVAFHSQGLEAMPESTRVVRADRLSQVKIDRLSKAHESKLPIAYVAPRYPRWKRTMDVAAAVAGLAFAAPVIATAAFLIKLTSPGPVLFRQMRTGQFGRQFAIYKLRTMVVNAEELNASLHQLNERDGPAFKIKRDPRVTTVGRFLRKTGIDELPQLWNVLIGDMAMVGPRPLPCDEAEKCLQWHRRRLDTKPGLTCIWQISKSRKVSFDEWMRMDLRYSDSRSVRSDVSLMLRTVSAVLLGRVGH